jgi:acetyltransferase-like isoleucine patch superfamily enzyme
MKVIKILYNGLSELQMRLYRSVMIYLFNLIKDCRINKAVVINKKSSFSNVGINYGTYLSVNAKVSNTEIGKFCSIGPNLVCGFGIHPINGISTSPSFYSTEKQNGLTFSFENKVEENKTIYIGNDVFIGANVTILDGVTIGDGAVIGAGAVVSKNIAPYAIAIGCPIKIIKYRFPPDIIEKLLLIKWWDRDEIVWQNIEKHFYNIDEFIKNIE